MKRRCASPGCGLLLLPCAHRRGRRTRSRIRSTDEAQLRAALSRPAAKLAKAQVLEGEFRHSRHLSEIPRPLIATGEFIFVRDLGVYWHTQQPFDSVVRAHRGGHRAVGRRRRRRCGCPPTSSPRCASSPTSSWRCSRSMSRALRRDFDLYGGQAGNDRLDHRPQAARPRRLPACSPGDGRRLGRRGAGGADRRARRSHRHRSRRHHLFERPAWRRRARLVRARAAVMPRAAPLRLRFIGWSVLMLALLAVFALRVVPHPRVETDILALLPHAQIDRGLRCGAR